MCLPLGFSPAEHLAETDGVPTPPWAQGQQLGAGGALRFPEGAAPALAGGQAAPSVSLQGLECCRVLPLKPRHTDVAGGAAGVSTRSGEVKRRRREDD